MFRNFFTFLLPLSQDWNDLVFKNRNKIYGAYLLRKRYPANMSFAFVIANVFLLSILIIPFIRCNEESEMYTFTDVVLQEPPPMRLPELPSKSIPNRQIPQDLKIATETKSKKPSAEIPVIIDDKQDDPSEIKKEKTNASDTKDTESSVASSDSILTYSQTEGEGEIAVDFADVMPQFPGGNSALIRFLSSKLIYPLSAHQNKIEGVVVIGFVIDKNGRLRNPKILKALYPDCDAEALRVVRMIPDWIPAKNQGRNVSINFRLPIEFKLARR